MRKHRAAAVSLSAAILAMGLLLAGSGPGGGCNPRR